jgi:hypothetical protein
MDITTFFQSPDYFPEIMIFASGYILIFSIFGKTKAWKELDSALRVVLALVVGFGVEFCIVLPIFYLNLNNLNTVALFLPAFNATWTYHWAITGIIAVTFALSKNREFVMKNLNIVVLNIMFPFFVTFFVFFAIASIEYNSVYPAYIRNSTPFLYYFPINVLFSFLGVIFCYIFSIYLNRAYEDERFYGKSSYSFVLRSKTTHWQTQLFLFNVWLNKKAKQFLHSKKIVFLIIATFIMIGSIIPLDNEFSFFTPKIKSYLHAILPYNVSDGSRVQFSWVVSTLGFAPPSVTSVFWQTRCDTYQFTSGVFDMMGVVTMPFDSDYLGKSIRTTNYFSPANLPIDGIDLIVPYNLENRVNVTLVPNATNPSGFQVNYAKIGKQPFNLTLGRWENVNISSVSNVPLAPQRTRFNDTCVTWKQTFVITNGYSQNIYVSNIQYDSGLNYVDIDQQSFVIYYNGAKLESAKVFGSLIMIYGLAIPSHTSATIELQFVATNNFSF